MEEECKMQFQFFIVQREPFTATNLSPKQPGSVGCIKLRKIQFQNRYFHVSGLQKNSFKGSSLANANARSPPLQKYST